MVDPLSLDIVSALAKDPLALSSSTANLASGNFGALLAGDPETLLAETSVNVEAAAILDLVDQAVTESSRIACNDMPKRELRSQTTSISVKARIARAV